ncbi:UDP-N-acetylmuramate:L-alanyl-gamma-D-glutamyl-meso-diaminopimelate ligase, partial [Pseudomonas syringae pv. tagetis]
LRKKVGDAPFIGVIEPRSNSMKLGAHRYGLPDSVNQADHVVWYAPPSLASDLSATLAGGKVPAEQRNSLEAIIASVHSH